MKPLVLGTAALLAGCTATPPALPTDLPELAGRTVGAPTRCITFRQSESLRIAGPHTLIYRDGRTLWVNSVPACSAFRHSDILVTQVFGSQYCSGDMVHTRDNSSHIPGPSCRLNDFVPYTRP